MTFGIPGKERFSVDPLSYYISDSKRRGIRRPKASVLAETSARPSLLHKGSILLETGDEDQRQTQPLKDSEDSVPEPDPDVERS